LQSYCSQCPENISPSLSLYGASVESLRSKLVEKIKNEIKHLGGAFSNYVVKQNLGIPEEIPLKKGLKNIWKELVYSIKEMPHNLTDKEWYVRNKYKILGITIPICVYAIATKLMFDYLKVGAVTKGVGWELDPNFGHTNVWGHEQGKIIFKPPYFPESSKIVEGESFEAIKNIIALQEAIKEAGRQTFHHFTEASKFGLCLASGAAAFEGGIAIEKELNKTLKIVGKT
jgi:hypothetical protein